MGIVELVGSRGFEQLWPDGTANFTARAVPAGRSWWYAGQTCAIIVEIALVQWWWGLNFLWALLVVVGMTWLFFLVVAWWPGLPPARRGPMVAAYFDQRFVLARAHWLTGRGTRIVLDVPLEAVSRIPTGAPPTTMRVRVEDDAGFQDWDLLLRSAAM